MNKACVEGIEVLSFRQISEEKKMTGMTILAAADYLVQPHNRRCILRKTGLPVSRHFLLSRKSGLSSRQSEAKRKWTFAP